MEDKNPSFKTSFKKYMDNKCSAFEAPDKTIPAVSRKRHDKNHSATDETEVHHNLVFIGKEKYPHELNDSSFKKTGSTRTSYNNQNKETALESDLSTQYYEFQKEPLRGKNRKPTELTSFKFHSCSLPPVATDIRSTYHHDEELEKKHLAWNINRQGTSKGTSKKLYSDYKPLENSIKKELKESYPPFWDEFKVPNKRNTNKAGALPQRGNKNGCWNTYGKKFRRGMNVRGRNRNPSSSINTEDIFNKSAYFIQNKSRSKIDINQYDGSGVNLFKINEYEESD